VAVMTGAGAAREALRWVVDAAVPAPGGLTWPEFRRPGSGAEDDLYAGTAGVLMAFAEARLSGIRDFDAAAAGAVSRLRYVGRAGLRGRRGGCAGGARPAQGGAVHRAERLPGGAAGLGPGHR
jgi:hypothetical protein